MNKNKNMNDPEIFSNHVSILSVNTEWSTKY